MQFHHGFVSCLSKLSRIGAKAVHVCNIDMFDMHFCVFFCVFDKFQHVCTCTAILFIISCNTRF